MSRSRDDVVIAAVLTVAALAIAAMGFFGGVLVLYTIDGASGAAYTVGVGFLISFEVAISMTVVLLGWHISRHLRGRGI